jgi:hypothetical protein
MLLLLPIGQKLDFPTQALDVIYFFYLHIEIVSHLLKLLYKNNNISVTYLILNS